MVRRAFQVFFGVLGLGVLVFVVTREPRQPALPKWQMERKLMDRAKEVDGRQRQRAADVALVKGLLGENLGERRFDFGLVVAACSGKKVIPLDASRESHGRVLAAIRTAMEELVVEMSREDSPLRELRRINEGSKFFEDGLLAKIDVMDGLKCEFPQTRGGVAQRSGYPDLRIVDEVSGEVFYLDPKLVEEGSRESTLRTFYFEPKGETLKITDDAVHLLVGIGHDGKAGEWEFSQWELVDLSLLKVRLKAEFQASNRDLYGRGRSGEAKAGGAR